MLLREHLAAAPFTLSMSCSFFGYFAHCGALLALTEAGLKPERVTGSSAGAVVAGLYGAGYDAADMLDVFGELDFSDVFSFAPTLYWGFPYVGVFRQNLAALEDRLLQNRPKDIEGCRVPTALSVYDATDKELRVLTSGPLSVGIAASAAVPGLMHGVDDADGHRLVDAGVGGDMLGVAGCGDDENVLCINLFLRAFIPQAPPRLRKLLIVDLFGVPFVTPNSLKEKGPLARDAAYAAMKHALETPLPEYAGGPRRLEVNKAGDAPPSRPEAQAHQASFVDLVRS